MAVLKFLTPNIHKTVSRFPASVFCCLCLFVMIVTKIIDTEQMSMVFCILVYGFFAFGIARLMAEAHAWSWIKEISLGAVLTLSTFSITVYYGAETTAPAMFVTFFLAVLVAPFLFRKSNDLSFWNFGYQFFAGFILASLGAILLNSGIFVAFIAVGDLFDVQIPADAYLYTGAFIYCVYAPFNALSWMPEKFDVEPLECNTPRGLPFLLNWILAPLAILYFIILYAYSLKILIDWELPSGQIVYMVSGFGALGIIFYVSGWTLREEGSAAVRFLYKHFFKLLILPIILLLIAVYLRIDQYGLTIDRYLIAILGVWFGAMALLFTLRPQSPLKIIPGSILVILTLALFGPWGMVSLSSQSQLSRLEKLLAKNNMIKDGIAVPAKEKIPFKDMADILSIVDYFDSTNKIESIEPYFPGLKKTRYDDAARDVSKMLEIPYIDKYERQAEGDLPPHEDITFYAAENNRFYTVKGYDKVHLNLGAYREQKHFEEGLLAYLTLDDAGLVYHYGGKRINMATGEQLFQIVEKFRMMKKMDAANARPDPIVLDAISGTKRFRYIMTSGQGELYDDNKFIPNTVGGIMFIDE